MANNVLEQIVEDKIAEVAVRKQEFPLSAFIDKLKPCEKDFYAALAAPNASFILECKKASPSKGLIRENFNLDEIINAYAPHAACFSVLTDEKYFQGKFEYLDYVTSKVNQPVINKDFFVDEYQIYLARYHNADAVLLMLSVLDDKQYEILNDLTHSLNMHVLTEVSNEEEVERALALGANIIGINNRNLRDLSTDLATTERLVPLIKSAGFEGVILSESGIYKHSEIQRLSPLVDGFLVGSALMAEDNLVNAVEKLVFGEVKICGINSLKNAEIVAATPASYMGLIFATKSPRFVSLEEATNIANFVHQHSSKRLVGVFVDHPIEIVAEYARKLSLAAVQLHGNESESYHNTLRTALPPNCELWSVIGVKQKHKFEESTSAELTQEVADAATRSDRVLLDCKVGQQLGGTGVNFDWRLLENVPHKHKLVLAGGLCSNNINDARDTGVGILDVNSGVEDAPAEKSAMKLEQVFTNLRNY
ncbi:bifunctional indole-3-glycerol-phosphate synthase TrpC/phosphoribosylanthranilate isomerase TrpF [Glaciecola sp. MH2013]|uniref:bifunctional indole-3-glycerol-phosphate synthase TrpC/phosphoribosylanthranilate isomerase TrpF n=1 Tax=Glaciecola sp. MH2013 TaxID=2785524 RepID=UPI0018A0486F|nr:bifunctional indole-3-glycerol-phosphate synthase TrpC/phosphoribosylanthranilate isomerase TrpF [Glaciecola sp. MH2013]MBF7073133.1 bifunctional indole-3-glycerol-phosphate synthase TrpC/phosphoribosylanthranilate isomerase TrpF [Glaciecola sp. MH2013]